MGIRKTTWLIAAILWSAFTFWYTNTGGALSEEEIEHHLALMASRNAPESTIERLRKFMEEDDGRQFIMINVLDMADKPPPVAGADPGATSQDLLNHYTEYVYPTLFRRASHPIYAGRAIAPAMDLEGIEGAESWTGGALMRYRSRRDLVEMATNPEFGERHHFKLAALEKTIAYPVKNVLYYSDPRLLLALLLFSITSIVDLLLWRR